MPRPVSDWAAQDRGAWEHEQMIKAHHKEQARRWMDAPPGMTTCKPDVLD